MTAETLSSERVKAIRKGTEGFTLSILKKKRIANQEPGIQLKCPSEINGGEKAFLQEGNQESLMSTYTLQEQVKEVVWSERK